MYIYHIINNIIRKYNSTYIILYMYTGKLKYKRMKANVTRLVSTVQFIPNNYDAPCMDIDEVIVKTVKDLTAALECMSQSTDTKR